MDLTPYLDAVAADLERATALADEHTRDIAHRLAAAIEPGLRLALVRAVSDTAARINTELDEAVVTVTLAGQEPMLTVTSTGSGTDASGPPPLSAGPSPTSTTATAASAASEREGGPPGRPGATGADGEGERGTVRITLRLPEHLKGRAEDLADGAEQSLNTWLVQTVRRATAEPRGASTTPSSTTTSTTGSRRITGWA